MDENNEVKELKFSPAVFDPNKEQLQAIAQEVSQITVDPSKMTKDDLELVNTTKNKLVKARTAIQKRGKEIRAAAIKFQKDVIAYEDELIGIIEPEEKRLKEIESGAKEYAMKQERMKTLPEFKEKLASIGDAVEVSDEELLALDPNQRDAYYNGRLQAKLEADRAAADAKRAEEDAAREAEAKKIQEEKDAIEREKKQIAEREYNIKVQSLLSLGMIDEGQAYTFPDPENPDFKFYNYGKDALQNFSGDWNAELNKITSAVNEAKKKIAARAEEKRQADIKEAAEKARKEEQEKAEAERKQLEEKRLAEEAAAKKEADEKERKEREAEERRTKEEKYNNWLKDNSYNAETDIIKFDNGVTTLYRKISDFRHE